MRLSGPLCWPRFFRSFVAHVTTVHTTQQVLFPHSFRLGCEPTQDGQLEQQRPAAAAGQAPTRCAPTSRTHLRPVPTSCCVSSPKQHPGACVSQRTVHTHLLAGPFPGVCLPAPLLPRFAPRSTTSSLSLPPMGSTTASMASLQRPSTSLSTGCVPCGPANALSAQAPACPFASLWRKSHAPNVERGLTPLNLPFLLHPASSGAPHVPAPGSVWGRRSVSSSTAVWAASTAAGTGAGVPDDGHDPEPGQPEKADPEVGGDKSAGRVQHCVQV